MLEKIPKSSSLRYKPTKKQIATLTSYGITPNNMPWNRFGARNLIYKIRMEIKGGKR